MSKPVKGMVTAELKERYAGVHGACVVDLTGLEVKSQEAVRAALRKKSARLEVVKNSLARRAFQGTPLEALGRSLEGPCALVTSSESLIEVAKALVESAKEFTELKLKQAMIDGDPSLMTVEGLSKMKNRGEVVGELAMLIGSPGRAVAGCLQSPQSKIAGCLKGMVEKAA
jgi:large subunit ribosomal protein L10